MEQFLGLSPVAIVLGLALALALLVGVAVFAGGRGVPLARLGARNLPRRPARAALIVVGLALATTTISAAFGTGDTIASTLRALVTATLGTTDEAIVLYPPRQSAGDRARALTSGAFGGLKTNDLGFFSDREYAALRDRVAGNPAIGALAPAIADQVTVVLGEAGETRTAIGLLALTTPAPTFGVLRATDGTPINLEALPADGIVVNAAAAGILGVQAGGTLAIRTQEPGARYAGAPAEEWPVRIAALAENGGIAGASPLLLVPLPAYQRAIGRQGQLNQILVANGGGAGSVARTAAASSALRGALVERGPARDVQAHLARPENQRALLEAAGTLRGRDREKLLALRLAATGPDLSPEFISLVTDPRVRAQLLGLARRLPNFGERRTLIGQLASLTVLSVLEVKQEGLDQADEYGGVVTTVFLVLGIFSLGAAVLLIYLIFALLATDRAPELATLRALGVGRRQVGAIFLAEGLLYALLGAALGAGAGVLATRLTVRSLAAALAGFGYDLAPRIEPRSIAIAFLGGALLTFAAMCACAWRIGHAEIVAGTRGVDRAEGRGGGLVAGVALLVAAALVWRRWLVPASAFLPAHPLVLPGILSLLVLGATLVADGVVGGLRRARTAPFRAALGTGTGFLLLGIWLRALWRLPTPGVETRDDAIGAAVGGLALIVAGVWTATRALAPALRGLDRALSPFARARLIVRPAAAYLAAARARTALTVTMFGMVVFIMVAALALIETLVDAYAGNTPPVAGFDLRADLPASFGTGALTDLDAALADATGIRRAAFGPIGGVVSLDARAIQLGTARAIWRDAAVVAADDGFLAGTAVALERRATGYADDAAVWRAVRAGGGLAVVTGATASSFLAPPAGDGAFAPFVVWVRANDGGAPLKLTIIGITDPGAELPPGLWTSRASAAGLGIAIPAPTTYYLALAPGTAAADAAAGLRLAFADRSLVVTDLNTTIRLGRSIRALLTQLVQGFMGLGLLAGVAALGIIGIQSVIERRQQLGTLRALGYTRGQVRATLAFESAAVAALGIALGTALGLLLARSLVTLLATRAPEIRFAIPWGQIGLTIALAWLGTLGALALAAWQAGRVSPADALRATA